MQGGVTNLDRQTPVNEDIGPGFFGKNTFNNYGSGAGTVNGFGCPDGGRDDRDNDISHSYSYSEL